MRKSRKNLLETVLVSKVEEKVAKLLRTVLVSKVKKKLLELVSKLKEKFLGTF